MIKMMIFSQIEDPEYIAIKVLAIQFTAAYVLWIFGKFACKVNIQEVAFALPLTLVMPTSVAGILGNSM